MHACREHPETGSKQTRFRWRRARETRHEPLELERVVCSLCWSTDAHCCPCGWELVEQHDAEALEEFGMFVKSSKNPLLHIWDMEDQRELAESMQEVVCQAKVHGLSSKEQDVALVLLAQRALLEDPLRFGQLFKELPFPCVQLPIC